MWYKEDKNPTWNWKRLQSLMQDRRTYKYWGPTKVETYEKALSSGTLADFKRAEYMKNVVYSFQYLEFIQVQIDELTLLTDVLKKQLYKNYIITSIGIIECIFSHLVTSNNLQNKSEWISEGEPEYCDPFIENRTEKRYIRQKQVRLPEPKDENTTFFDAIKIVVEHNLIHLPSKGLDIMHEIRKLRNKVHLSALRHENDTDYLGIDERDFIKVRYVLHTIVSEVMDEDADKSCFDFIKPSDEEIETTFDSKNKGTAQGKDHND